MRIFKSRSAFPMATAVARPSASSWRSDFVLSGFAVSLLGASRRPAGVAHYDYVPALLQRFDERGA